MKLFIKTIFLILFNTLILHASILSIKINQENNITHDIQPIVSLNHENIDSIFHKDTKTWTYNIDIPNNILKKVLYINLNTIPDGYKFYPITIEMNHINNEHIELELNPKKEYTDSSANKISKIYGKNLSSLNRKSLLALYQEFRFIAQARINRTEKNNIHYKDIQGVFKYLELVRNLNQKYFILPPNDIDKFIDWFDANINTSALEYSTISKKTAQQMVAQVKNAIGTRFDSYWKSIQNQTNNEIKYLQLQSYKNMLTSIDSDIQKDIKKKTGTYMVIVLAKISIYLTKEIKCDHILTKQQSTERISQLIEEFEQERASTKNTQLKRVINARTKELKDLSKSLLNNVPMTCEKK